MNLIRILMRTTKNSFFSRYRLAHTRTVREILFKSRLLVRESTSASRILVLTFVDLVDMFENIMATHYDYADMREKFKGTGILERCS